MKKKFLQITMAFILVAITNALFAQKIALNLNKGQKIKVLSTTETKTSMTVMGQEMENNVSSKSTTQVVVLNNEKGTYEVGQTITNLQSNAQAMGQEMNYDSDKKDNTGPVAEAMDKMVNKENKITVDDNGKVIKGTKSDEGSNLDSPTMPGAGSDLVGIAVIIKSLFNQDIRIGNTWMDSISTNTEKMKMKNVSSYTVSNIELDIATIAYNSTISTDGTMEQMGQEMTMTSSNKIMGILKVNIKNGIVVNNTSDGIGTSNIEAQGMSIPVSSTTKTVIKVITE